MGSRSTSVKYSVMSELSDRSSPSALFAFSNKREEVDKLADAVAKVIEVFA